jgi:DNA-binding NarL/FixJ family response regulator
MSPAKKPAAKGKARTVLLCDDHEIVREAIKSRMADEDSVDIVGEAKDGVEAVEMAKELAPDVAIVDVEMPKRDGIEATREIRKAAPTTRVIVFTGHTQPDLVSLALEAGASGFVPKSAPSEDIARAVRTVAGGGTFLGGAMPSHVETGLDRLLNLSTRERQILELLAEGLRVKQIGERLFLSPATVHTHVRNAIAKLEVDTRTEAVALAIKFGYLGAAGSDLEEEEEG